jgi:hypothetical protein
MSLIKITRLFVLLSLVTLYYACSKSSSGGTSGTCDPNVSYSTQLLPLLNQKCNFSGCHDNSSAAALNNYVTVRDGAAQIKSSVVAGRMPRNGTLTAAEKSIITCWVDSGAKNN